MDWNRVVCHFTFHLVGINLFRSALWLTCHVTVHSTHPSSFILHLISSYFFLHPSLFILLSISFILVTGGPLVLGHESNLQNDPDLERRRKAETYALEMTIQIKRAEREKKRQELETEFSAVFLEVEKKKKVRRREKRRREERSRLSKDVTGECDVTPSLLLHTALALYY